MTAPDDPEAQVEAIMVRLANLRDPIPGAVARAEGDENDWASLADGIPCKDLPELLCKVWKHLAPLQRMIAISEAWVKPETPEWCLSGPGLWLPMFKAVGYHDETQLADPPQTIQLWRGGTIAQAMSWTGTRSKAEWFRDRRDDGTGKLWTATVGADQLLAHYNLLRSEDEYVIDPTGIRPEEV